MWNSFLPDFVANLLSDLLAGLVLGLPVAWWLGNKLSVAEWLRHRKQDERADLDKAMRYTDLLRSEVAGLVTELPRVIESFSATDWGKEFWLSAPLWEALQPSGELPRLLNPGLVEMLSMFYDHIARANHGKDLLVRSWMVSAPSAVPSMSAKQKAFREMTLLGLTGAQDVGARVLTDWLPKEVRAHGDRARRLNGASAG